MDADIAYLETLSVDPIMADLIDKYGLLVFQPRSPFVSLVRAVVGQQLSAKAASTIFSRLFSISELNPLSLLLLPETSLRAAGLSRSKIRYIKDISAKESEGYFDVLRLLRDDEVVDLLTRLPGVGRWSAEMVLIFSLKRPNVWPVADAGLFRAARLLYDVSKQTDLLDLGDRFHPWRSYAARYLWIALDDVG